MIFCICKWNSENVGNRVEIIFKTLMAKSFPNLINTNQYTDPKNWTNFKQNQHRENSTKAHHNKVVENQLQRQNLCAAK